jgi:hypothetical protein
MAISPQENGAGDQVTEHSGPVLIKGQYLVDVDTPISDLDMPSAKAYEVSDKRNIDKKVFGLVCRSGLPVRLDIAPKLISTDNIGIMRLVTWDVVFWPLINQKTIIVIYERPLGGSVLGAIERGDFKVSEGDFQSIIFEPVYQAIAQLADDKITHREIRAENLFFMDNECKEVVLGDCITCPPGFDQPVIYEPVHRGMASVGGRGGGDLSDDIYAFGVTIAVLLLDEKLTKYETLEELFTAKIERGTYNALCGKRRTFASLLEPLRGTLIDDLEGRWGREEMLLWLGGRKNTPMQHKPLRQATKPYIFMEREYLNPRILAHAFTKNVKEGAESIKNKELEIWLRDSLREGDLADSINAISVAAAFHANEVRGSDDQIVTKASILMDPLGPIRYKGLSFMPDGYGSALAVELLLRNSMQTAAEVLRYNIPKIWYDAPSDEMRDGLAFNFKTVFVEMWGALQIVGPGFGIERCLYELNSSLSCQSPLIAEQCVVNIQELLPALDSIADQTNKKLRPLDRHVTAFIAARFKESMETQLSALAEQKDSSFLIGMISLLAHLQSRLKGKPVCALTSWAGSLMGPAVKTYFNRSTRRAIEEQIPRVARQGSLLELLNLIDGAEKRQQDTEGYDNARLEHSLAKEQIQEIKSGDLSSPEAAVEQGQKFAALTSLVILMIFITILVLSELS